MSLRDCQASHVWHEQKFPAVFLLSLEYIFIHVDKRRYDTGTHIERDKFSHSIKDDKWHTA